MCVCAYVVNLEYAGKQRSLCRLQIELEYFAGALILCATATERERGRDSESAEVKLDNSMQISECVLVLGCLFIQKNIPKAKTCLRRTIFRSRHN